MGEELSLLGKVIAEFEAVVGCIDMVAVVADFEHMVLLCWVGRCCGVATRAAGEAVTLSSQTYAGVVGRT